MIPGNHGLLNAKNLSSFVLQSDFDENFDSFTLGLKSQLLCR
jgi:hypothetical protein